MKFLGYVILSQRELDLQERIAAQEKALWEERISVQTKLADKALAEIAFYQKKYEESLDRADRQLDSFMNSVGMPEVTATGRRETAEKVSKAEEQLKKKELEIAELYSDTMNTMYDMDGLELTPELQEESDRLLGQIKAESDSNKNA